MSKAAAGVIALALLAPLTPAAAGAAPNPGFWNQLVTQPPSPGIEGATAIYDALRDRVVLFGNPFFEPSCSQPGNLPWALPFSALAWATLPPSDPCPGTRTGMTAVYDPGRDRAILFGGFHYAGFGNNSYVNDCWVLPLSSPMWELLSVQGTPPTPRSGYCAIFDVTRDRMIVYGGAPQLGVFDDLWVLDFSPTPTWTEIPHSGPQPGPRVQATMIYDPDNDQAVMFGGVSDVSNENSTWALSLADLTWAQLTPSGTPPSPRYAHSATFDTDHRSMLMYGGRDNQTLGFAELWELSLTGSPQWTPIVPQGTGPGPRSGQLMMFDTHRSRLLMYGGYNANTSNVEHDIWTIGPDEPTPTLISRFDARAIASGIEIRWSARDRSLDASAWIERAAAAEGPWNRLDLARHSEGDEEIAIDPDVETGTTYWYRLATTSDVGAATVLASASVTAGARMASAELFAPFPSPSRGAISAEFTLPANGRIRLELLDVSGRKVATLAAGGYPAGRSQIRWDAHAVGSELRPGVYTLRLQGVGRPLERKLVVIP